MAEQETIQDEKKRRKKRRGLGTVRWREDIKKYVIDYYDRLGKRHIETVGTSMREAGDLLHKKMNEIKNGTFNPAKQDKTFKEFSEDWIKGKVVEKNQL